MKRKFGNTADVHGSELSFKYILLFDMCLAIARLIILGEAQFQNYTLPRKD